MHGKHPLHVNALQVNAATAQTVTWRLSLIEGRFSERHGIGLALYHQ